MGEINWNSLCGQAARQVQEEVARQQAQAIAPTSIQTVPQTQPTHQAQGHPQHMMGGMNNANAATVPFRGSAPQMSPTPRAPLPPAPGPTAQIRHAGLPGMDQMPRYTGIPPTRPVTGNMPNQQQNMAMLSNQPPPPQQQQQQQQPQQAPSQQQQGECNIALREKNFCNTFRAS